MTLCLIHSSGEKYSSAIPGKKAHISGPFYRLLELIIDFYSMIAVIKVSIF